MDIPSDTPSSPESSQLTCGQRPLIDFLEDSLLTSFKLNKHKTPTEKPKLTDSDFTFVKSLAGTVSTLTTAKDHITKQIATLTRAIQQDTPPTYILKASRPPHPHRELIFRKSFQDNWDRLNQRAAIAFTKLSLEEYTHQAEEVEWRLTKATKSAQKNIAEHFKNEHELTMAHNLYKFFTTPRPPPTRGKKRPTERVEKTTLSKHTGLFKDPNFHRSFSGLPQTKKKREFMPFINLTFIW